jgi:hypothetical protein
VGRIFGVTDVIPETTFTEAGKYFCKRVRKEMPTIEGYTGHN